MDGCDVFNGRRNFEARAFLNGWGAGIGAGVMRACVCGFDGSDYLRRWIIRQEELWTVYDTFKGPGRSKSYSLRKNISGSC